MNTTSLPGQNLRPNSSEILSTIKPAAASDPLSIIKANLRNDLQPATFSPPSEQSAPAPIAPLPAVSFAVERVVEPTSPLSLTELTPPIPEGAPPPPPIGEPPKSDPSSAPVEQPKPVESKTGNPILDKIEAERLEKEQKRNSKEESVKDLRKKSQELETQVQEKDRILAEREAELQKYKSGEAVSDVIVEKDERIQELTHFEKLHNFKLSKEYSERFIQPMEALKEKALKVAGDYQVGQEILDHALSIENKKDLNAFLLKHFDEVGALEVRELLGQMKTLYSESVAAELKPEEEFTKLREQREAAERNEEQRRTTELSEVSRSSWTDAISDLRGTNQYPELVVSGNADHDKIGKQLHDQASSEFGKMIRLLASAGLKELPKEAAKILAKRFMLSEMTAVTAASRSNHYREAQDVIETAKKVQPYMRPPVGGSFPSSGAGNGGPAVPQNVNEAAQMALAAGRARAGGR